jgi:hypothetical protein
MAPMLISRNSIIWRPAERIIQFHLLPQLMRQFGLDSLDRLFQRSMTSIAVFIKIQVAYWIDPSLIHHPNFIRASRNIGDDKCMGIFNFEWRELPERKSASCKVLE